MIITPINEFRTEISLTVTEQQEYGVSFGEMSYREISTRQFLTKLMKEANNRGYDINMSGRTLIEVMKKKDGTLVIAFTALENKQTMRSSARREPGMLAVFCDKEKFSRFCKELPKTQSTGALFYKNGYLFLLLPYISCRDKEVRELLQKYTLCCVLWESAVQKKCENNLLLITPQNGGRVVL